MSYEYNVPYVDFVNEFDENDGADTFFDINTQIGKLDINDMKEECEEQDNKIVENESESKKQQNDDTSSKSSAEINCESLLNASVSVNEIVISSDQEERPKCAIKDDTAKTETENTVTSSEASISKRNPKKKVDITDVSSVLTSNVQNIKNNKKRKSDIDHHTSKFISLAEGVRQFQAGTPPRFRSRPKGQTGFRKNESAGKVNKHLTIPQSPHLLSKLRSRPVEYTPPEKREEKEVKEIQSYKLKINPINAKILEPPKVGRRVARAPIVVEPFNLTEFKKKEIKISSPFQFKAKEIPKAILEHPTGIPEKKKIPLTKPSTPSVLAKHKMKFQTLEEVDGKYCVGYKDAHDTGVPLIASVITKSSPQPFSFEERDKKMMKHKEDMIKKVLQEEKEARKFHANPIPNYLKKIARSHDTTISSTISTADSEEYKKPIFKARPATVLQKKAFVPKKPERSIIGPDNFMLNTEERAKQRAEFDAALQQHYKSIEEELSRRKDLEEQKAKEEVALLRKQAVHKAQPVRAYKAIPESVKAPLTSPRSPRFTKPKI